MTQITKANVQSTAPATRNSWLIRHRELLAPVFLITAGVIMLTSNYLTLFGFTGLLPIAVAIASIISGGILIEHWQRYAWLAVLIATGGAALCLIGLITQLQAAEFIAATVNSGVILLQMTGAILALHHLAQPQG